AEPASHGLGSRSGVPGTWSASRRRALSDWLVIALASSCVWPSEVGVRPSPPRRVAWSTDGACLLQTRQDTIGNRHIHPDRGTRGELPVAQVSDDRWELVVVRRQACHHCAKGHVTRLPFGPTAGAWPC